MTKLVNYKKRSVQLPVGCKNLVDVLRPSTKGKNWNSSADWRKVFRGTERISTLALARIEHHVVKLMESQAKCGVLLITSFDMRITLQLLREPTTLDLIVHVNGTVANEEELLRAYFDQRGISPYLHHDFGVVVLPRFLQYPMPLQAAGAACAAADLLKSVYGMGDAAGLDFTYD